VSIKHEGPEREVEGLTIVAQTPEQRSAVDLIHAGNAHRRMTMTRSRAFARTFASITIGVVDGPGLDATRRWLARDLFMRRLEGRSGLPKFMRVP